MFLKTTTLADFKTFISDLAKSEKAELRVFLSSASVKGAGSWNLDQSSIKFRLVLLSSIYNVFYSNLVSEEKYNDIIDDLLTYRKDNNYKFKIQQFETIKLNEEETNLIIKNKEKSF